ncbi:MAG: ABC transporter permease subunit [Candidatus Odinarchaeota archaeon]|nr:ABC transporter permease subunit [Candidatus Odinarchaeota archaeon]
MEKKSSSREILTRFKKENFVNFFKSVPEKVYEIKTLTIALMEFTTFVKTKKFWAIFLVILFPVIVAYFPPIDNIANISMQEFLRHFEQTFSDPLLNFWTGIPTQIVAAMVASELIAGELDKETLKLLFTKPLRKVSILLGKFTAYLLILLSVFIPTLAIYSVYYVLMYGKGYEEIVAILSGPYWWGIALVVLCISFVGSISIALSSMFKKPLYAALATILLIVGVQLFSGLIPFVTDPQKYTFTYQLGIVIEEVFYLGGSNIYKGDPYLAVTFFVTSSIIALIVAEFALIRKEVP